MDGAAVSEPLWSGRCYYVTRSGLGGAGYFSGEIRVWPAHLAVGRSLCIPLGDIATIRARHFLLWTIVTVTTSNAGSIYLSTRDAALFAILRSAWIGSGNSQRE